MVFQNVFNTSNSPVVETQLIIGFCQLIRKSALEKVGGVDDTLPGGDDFDLSIRMVDGGYKLLCDRTVFIYHHGFKTGERLHGASNVSNGWNSYEMMEKTNRAIIAKHGFARWQKLMLTIMKAENYNEYTSEIDTEGKIIRKILAKKGKRYELGCGS